MATVIVVLFLALMVMWILTKACNSISKSVQKMSGHNKCEQCGCRLKAVNGQYRPLCRKCGTIQTWAAKAIR